MKYEVETDSVMIARAEGHYAAKTFANLSDNPYPVTSINHSFWNQGFMNELINLRTDLKVMREYLGTKLEENEKLRRDNESLKREIRYMEFRYIEEYDERDAYEAVEAEMAQ